MNIRSLFFACSLLCCISLQAWGQEESFEKATFNGDLYEYFGVRLTYPKEMIKQGITGVAELEFHINRLGKLDSIEFIRFPDERVAEEIVTALIATKDMWTASRFNGQAVDFKYKLLVRYSLTDGPNIQEDESKVLLAKAEKKAEKGKHEEALLLINRAMGLNPYNASFFLLRSNIHQLAGNPEQSAADRRYAAKLEQEIACDLRIVGYSTTMHTRTR